MKITKTILLLLFIANGIPSKLQAQYGVLDSNGKIMIPFEYGKTWYYHDGYFAVLKNGKAGVIDMAGNVVLPFEYEATTPFSEGLAAVKKDGKYGYVDLSGNLVIPYQYDNAHVFNNGRAMVMIREDRTITKALINNKGDLIIPFNYTYITPTEDGLYKVTVNNKNGLFDKDGKEIVPVEYSIIFKLSDELRKVQKMGKMGYLDANGMEVIPCIYNHGTDFKEGVAVVFKDGKYQLINKAGETIIAPDYEYINDSHQGWLSFSKNGKKGFIDLNGKEIIPAIYSTMSYFDGNLVVVAKEDNLQGAIDKNGKTVIPFIYEYIGPFSSGYASVRKNGNVGLIDNTGRLVVPFTYDEVRPFNNGFSVIRQGRKYGIMDSTLTIIAPPIYDTYTHVHANSNQIWLKKDGKKGCLNFQGNLLVPFIFDEARPSKLGYTICKTDNPAAVQRALNSGKEAPPAAEPTARLHLEFIRQQQSGSDLILTYRLVNAVENDVLILQAQKTIPEFGNNPELPMVAPEFFQLALSPEEALCLYAPLFNDAEESNPRKPLPFKKTSDFVALKPGAEMNVNLRLSNYTEGLCKEDLSSVKLKLQYLFDKRYLDKTYVEARTKEARLNVEEAKLFYELLQQCYKGEISSDEVTIDLN